MSICGEPPPAIPIATTGSRRGGKLAGLGACWTSAFSTSAFCTPSLLGPGNGGVDRGGVNGTGRSEPGGLSEFIAPGGTARGGGTLPGGRLERLDALTVVRGNPLLGRSDAAAAEATRNAPVAKGGRSDLTGGMVCVGLLCVGLACIELPGGEPGGTELAFADPVVASAVAYGFRSALASPPSLL